MTAPGYTYAVSPAQRRAFAALPDEEKIRWLEEWQQATWELATPEVRAHWWRLRGKPFPPGEAVPGPRPTGTAPTSAP